MKTEYNIRISGSGTSEEIADALRKLAEEFELGSHVAQIEKTGECEWEDYCLMTEITEVTYGNDDDTEDEKPEQLFSIGEKVMVNMVGDIEGPFEITDIFWNGFTWMYSFEETQMRCGEMYLKKI